MRTEGLVAAAFTPMRPNGDFDLDAVPPLVEHLIREGVTGVFCNGTTGEGELLTPEERKATAAAFVSSASGRLPVFVQVGANSVRVAMELATHAAEIGADAIATTPPSYFRPATVPDLLECLKQVAAAAPDLPLYYYHLPVLTGVRLDMAEVMRGAGETVPSFAGIKFSEVDPKTFAACTEIGGDRHEVMWGSDETLLTGLGAGANAAIGSTYCFAARVYREVMAAHAAGDLETAKLWQERAARMVEIQGRRGGLSALKATMQLVGADCGPVRLPLRTPSPAAIEELRGELEGIGFFDWARP
jgi:N-acetylneuraminate lyase